MMKPGLRVCGFVYVISCCHLVLLSAAQVTHPWEVRALAAVKNSLIDSKKHLRTWNKGDPCRSNWTGVLCFNETGTDGYFHVEEIQLLNMNLSGTLAPELGQLSQLLILDFMWNDLTGTIPKEIGNISTLKLLLLSGNRLSGSLPGELRYLSNLNRLQIDQNFISGPLPQTFANLSSIKHLHLNNNSISGQIPVELSMLSTLIHLLMDNNNVSGYLPPELSRLPQLRIIQLDNNNFDGTEIPGAYGNLSRLAKLSLRNNSLRGSVPDLSRITKLFYLDLSGNHLRGPIPSNRLSDGVTTIDLSDNNLNGSIPGIFSDLPHLQKLSLRNNSLTGSVPPDIWWKLSFNTSTKLILDFRNNLLSSVGGDLNLPNNVTLRLRGNPICSTANITSIGRFCDYDAEGDDVPTNPIYSMMICPIQACPEDNFFEYVPVSPIPCFCAAPLRIGYRLKSPSFSNFPPHLYTFEEYLTKALELESYQLSIDSFMWEKGPRLRMYLKLFPMENNAHSSTFNTSEVRRLRKRFTTWDFAGNDFYGPYELLNFTLLGPYSSLNPATQKAGISEGILAVIILGAIGCAVGISSILILVIARRHAEQQRLQSRRRLSSKISKKIEGVKCFKFKELALATDNFNISTQVGQGGYGKVYRGVLSDDTIVAIKRAEEGSLQGQKEFLTEIELLSRVHHLNLVSLVGYCDEEGEQMLVYEFMPNGTLRDWLSAKGRENLNFERRLRLALGSAKGILYLHTEANPPVFHRDIKASNILLDSKLNAKVADFGLSCLAPVLDNEGTMPSHVSTVVKGTPGYLDPEYFLTHKLTDKSDVYSFGVVLLEIITGMQPIIHGKNIVREVNLARELGEMLSIIDCRMGSYPSECVERFVQLALECCNDKPEYRPSMLDVVRELENILNSILPAETDQTESYFTESTSIDCGQSETSSSSFLTRDAYLSSGVVDSGLISGVIPTIRPR